MREGKHPPLKPIGHLFMGKGLHLINPWMAVGTYMSHLDDGHNCGWDIYAQVKQCIIALPGQYSLAFHVFSWAAEFSNTVNTLVEKKDS